MDFNILEFLSKYNALLLAIVVIIILTISVIIFGFPKEIPMIYIGIIFGTLIGGIINLIGLFGGIWLGYEVGLTGRFGVERYRKKSIMQRYQNDLNKHGLRALFILRLFPLTPNDILSISSGFSKLKRKPYLILSFIGAIPYAFLWSYVGNVYQFSFLSLFPEVYNPITWLVSLIIIIIVVYILIKTGDINE